MKKYQCAIKIWNNGELKACEIIVVQGNTKKEAILSALLGVGPVTASCTAELYEPITLDQITTVEQLKERIVDGTLSLGNKYGKLMHLMSKEPAPGLEPVDVIYTNHGRHIVKRYI